MELAALGRSEFTLGFRLAGIRKVMDFKSEQDIDTLMRNPSVGVVIMEQETFDQLKEHRKDDVVNSIKPVFVVVSEQPQEELRKMIIRSIGVDLLREEK